MDASIAAHPPGWYTWPYEEDFEIDIEFEWRLLEVPADSETDRSDLIVDGATVAFAVDKAGVYRIEAIGHAEDGRSESRIAEITTEVAQIPYLLVEREGGVATVTPRQIDSAGGDQMELGPILTQSAASEAEWIATFDRDIAARTQALQGWHSTSRLAYPSSPSGITIVPSTGDDPAQFDATVFALAGRFAWITPSQTFGFDLHASDADGGYHDRILRSEGVPVRAPLQPVRPFWTPSDGIGWAEAAQDRAVGFDLWAATDSSTPAPARIMACADDPDHFSDLAQLSRTRSPRGLVGLLARDGERKHGQLYWLREREDGTFDCDSTSEDNHLIYQVPNDDESILEFELSPPFGEIVLFVKQLADGRSTEIHESHISSRPEHTPRLLSALPGRNTGVHFIAGGQQIAWTRTLYASEPGIQRPTSSEIWRMNRDGGRPTLLVAYPSTQDRAVLVTTGTGN